MPVNLEEIGTLHPVEGIELATTTAGIKKQGKPDLVLFTIKEGASCAATFTRNRFCAAPVVVAREHLDQATPRALLINSGNANAGTGDRGLDDARSTCRILASHIGCDPSRVLPFSTGVIGENLPMEKIDKAISPLIDGLTSDAWLDAASGIMTTDTVAKGVSVQREIDGVDITITGIAKGSGMIHPDMATMLSFIATDAAVDPAFLRRCLSEAVDASFNSITVDGDTSTNDACVLIATGCANNAVLDADHSGSESFIEALDTVCGTLARMIIRDGEGATKFVTVVVEEAASREEARSVAYTIANSPLVKTALFASDPNWGRILAAVGRSPVENIDIDKVRIYLDDVMIVNDGGRAYTYTEQAGQQVMDQDEITIRVSLGTGKDHATIWTTDLSHEYVSINADYRS